MIIVLMKSKFVMKDNFKDSIIYFEGDRVYQDKSLNKFNFFVRLYRKILDN